MPDLFMIDINHACTFMYKYFFFTSLKKIEL